VGRVEEEGKSGRVGGENRKGGAEGIEDKGRAEERKKGEVWKREKVIARRVRRLG